MSADRPDLDPPSSQDRRTKSRLTNHRSLLPDLDGRSAGARRFRDLVGQLVVDQGGFEQMSESRIQLVKRFAACCVQAEQMESRLASGDEIDVAEHALLCSTLTRIVQRIGIDRTPRNVTPTLEEHARRHYGYGEVARR
jgi:hypothetical protein